MKKRIATGGKILSIFLSIGLVLLMTPFTAKADIVEIPSGVTKDYRYEHT